MGDLRFDSDQQEEFGPPAARPSGSDLTGKLIAWGIVSNRQQAEYVMIGLAVLIAVIAFFVYRSTSG
ncbi:hypothetical protein A3F56_03645 [Candidatus Kaiserbacteria bacterium RIFCSPHIGHO2_12_FULL_55_13]|nr:MAG: hypothetical protein A3F56_03645 [Candidatus Kaiserbacteria bacterium RIFCSPHIGHO2_12_FULL_55_13]